MSFEQHPEYKILTPKVTFTTLPGIKPPPLATAPYSQLYSTLENWQTKETTAREAEHHQALLNSVRTTPAGDIGTGLTVKEDAVWASEVDGGSGRPIKAGKTPFKSTGKSNPTGAYARNLIRKAYNLPASFTVPVVHSGFAVSIQSPSNGEHLKLHEDLLVDKRRLGRSTYGIIFSTHTVLTNHALIGLITENIRFSTLSLPDGVDLIDQISIRDLGLLITGFANVIWPNGFKFSRACNSDATVCADVQEEIIDLSALFRFDTRTFTAKELEQLGRSEKNSVTIEEATEYRKSLKANADKLYAIDDKLGVLLTTPTIGEYFRYGNDWINRISAGVPEGMVNKSTENRESWFALLSVKAELSAFGHMVKEIHIKEFDEDGNPSLGDDGKQRVSIISNQTDIANILADLSDDVDVSAKITKAFHTHIGDFGAAMIGIPAYTCPTCKKHHTYEVDGKVTDFIPLDPIGLFFQMLRRAVLELNSKRVTLATYRQLEQDV